MSNLFSYAGLIACMAWLFHTPGFPPVVAVCGLLAHRLSTEYHAVIGHRILSVTPRVRPIRDLQHSRFSFTRAEYVNPMIIYDLVGWISDGGDQVVAINVTDSNVSNRYFATIESTDTDTVPLVTATDESTPDRDREFSYQWLGCSRSGIHLLRTWWWPGGSGIFCSIILVVVSQEPSIEIGTRGANKRERIVVKKVADIQLGDRYEGDITYRFGVLRIGACKGLATARKKTQWLFIV